MFVLEIKVGLFTNYLLYYMLAVCVQNNKDDRKMVMIIIYVYLNTHYMFCDIYFM